jgi:hypothetical protein
MLVEPFKIILSEQALVVTFDRPCQVVSWAPLHSGFRTDVSHGRIFEGGGLQIHSDPFTEHSVCFPKERLSRKCNGSRGRLMRSWEQKVNKGEKLTLTFHRNLLIVLGKSPLP